MALPGVVLITEYPWQQILDHWSDHIPSIADAGIVATALANRYGAVATFDQKTHPTNDHPGLGVVLASFLGLRPVTPEVAGSSAVGPAKLSDSAAFLLLAEPKKKM
jgi:hypothetical protein